ncbi:MAG: MarR family transcriptional regulator [Lentisphaeraceae bacterium]|nr:MarR family transcriptional regulator [Lentisphaeraceae bacterium]
MGEQSEIYKSRDFHTSLEELIKTLTYTCKKTMKVSNDYLRDFEISETQFNALMVLADYGDYENGDVRLTQCQLAERLAINKAASGTLVKRLQSSGWLRICNLRLDRRACYLELTQAGRDKYQAVFEDYYEYLWPLIEGLEEDDIRVTLKVLGLFRGNIQKLSRGDKFT